MKKIFNIWVIFFLLAAVFSCKDFYNYIITNDAFNQKKYKIIDQTSNVEYEFTGRYTWIVGDLYSSIRIRIKNRSDDELVFRSGKMQLVSKNYDYRLISGDYDIKIEPYKEDVFVLEYLAEFPYEKEHKLPNDEELRLIVNGVELNGQSLAIEDIYFVPETALDVRSKN